MTAASSVALACTHLPERRFDRLRKARDLPVYRFDTFREALVSIDRYALSLQEEAAERRARGLSVSDQDYSEEVFWLAPRSATLHPLVLLGGMGPLAGALAFRAACEKFGDFRTTILYQACSVPDRTSIILADRGARLTPADLDMGARLAYAIENAVDLLPRTTEQVDCIMACNSAHYFWEPLKARLACAQRLAQQVNLISTVECAVRSLRGMVCGRVLLLCTEGARAGRIFSGAAAAAGIPFEEPEPQLDRLLMRAIYDGVKSLDERCAVEFGTRFFQGILQKMGDINCIVAGCTELPSIIDLLKRRSTRTVSAFLSRVAVVDPLQAALDISAHGAGQGVDPGRDLVIHSRA